MLRKTFAFLVLSLGVLVASANADLVHHYTFDNEDGTDRVGSHDGIVEGNPTFVTGATGLPNDKAINLNEEGTDFHDDYVSFDELEFGPTFSITAWVKPGLDRQTNAIMTVVANTTGGFAGPDGFKWFVNNWNSDPVDGRLALESHDGITGSNVTSPIDTVVQDDEWHHLGITFDKDFLEVNMYHNGENVYLGSFLDFLDNQPWRIGVSTNDSAGWIGAIDDVGIFNTVLTADEMIDVFENGIAPPGGPTPLFAGDADMDFDFDQLDLVKVQVAAKYLSGAAATWGDGDWNGAPGGTQGAPPPGDALFNQIDIIAALAPGHYLTGPYAAVQSGGIAGDGQTSVGYDASTGEVWVDAPSGTELTSINIDSSAAIFTGNPAENLGGSFDNDADGNIFKATFGSSFGTISFGNVARAGMSEQFVLGDLTVVGSLAGGGDLGNVDLIYVPEPASVLLLAAAMVIGVWHLRPRRRCRLDRLLSHQGHSCGR